MRAQADDATDPVPELVERMVRRRRWVRTRRLGARLLVGALALGRWWGVVEHLRGDWTSLHPMLETTLFDSTLLLIAFVALGSGRVGPQLVARAILFGQLWLLVMAVGGLSVAELVFTVGACLALVLLGADRLDRDDGPFRPIHFRGPLVACILINGSLAIHGARLLLERFAINEPGFGFVDPWGVVVVLCLLAAPLGLYWLRTAALALPVLIAAVRLPASVDGILHSHQGVPPTLHAWFFFAANVALILTVVPVVWGLIRLRSPRRTGRAVWANRPGQRLTVRASARAGCEHDDDVKGRGTEHDVVPSLCMAGSHARRRLQAESEQSKDARGAWVHLLRTTT